MKSFDDILREKLGEFEAPFDSAAWEQMEQKLEQSESDLDQDPAGIVDLMALQYLKDMESSAPEMAWESFESKLAASEMAEELEAGIDDLARRHLEDLQAPYNPSHWQLMRQHLDDFFSIKGIIYRYKLAEIALMLLLIWTIQLYVPAGGIQLGPDKTHNPQQPLEAPVTPSTSETNDPIAGNEESKTSENPESASADALIESEGSDNAPFGESQLSGEIPAENGSTFAEAEKSKATTGTINILPEQEFPATPETVNLPMPEFRVESLNPWIPLIPETAKKMTAAEPVASLQAGALELDNDLASKTILTKTLKEKHLRVNMLYSGDYNRIFTPADPLFGTEALYLDSIGYSTGILVDYQSGRFTFQSGALYSNKSYRPILPQQQYGTFDLLVVETFEGITLELLEIPFQLRFDLMPNNTKWNLFLAGGGSAELLLNPIYDISREPVVASRSSGKEPSPEEVKSVANKSRLNQKEFPAGLLDGGRLTDNSYLTANVGFGLERAINYRWSIYLQPQLQYQLPFGGFGPNNDRFHTVSLRLGTRVLVW
ncbi:MAG: PorT family protein [Bacteroidetes bacterium]|nr:PorT family protein [Bacteroidota bacterium]